MPERSCRAAGLLRCLSLARLDAFSILGGEVLVFKPRYNVQPVQYMPVILPGRKSWPKLRPQPIACQGGWPMPRPKGPVGTTAYLSLQNLSTAESSAYTKLMHAPSNRRNRKVKVLMRFIIAAARGIKQSTEALLLIIVNKLNELAVRLRENRTEIDNLRRQLSIMRKPVQLIDFSTSLGFPVYPLSRTSSVLASMEGLYSRL
jgi:hypothetical protein